MRFLRFQTARLISDIGNFMDVLVGFSVVTGLEVFGIFFAKAAEMIKKRRKKDKKQKSMKKPTKREVK